MTSPLWPSNFSVTIFDWNALFQQWVSRSVPPPPVKHVLANLRAATDPLNPHSPSISQFFTYLNFPEEKEGVYWLLYEAVASRWMFNEIRMDYVREIAQNIDIDLPFPEFIGTPSKSQTVREFLRANLSDSEFTSLHISTPNYMDECEHVNYPTTQIFIIRNLDTHTLDDKIIITKVDDDCYTFSYLDTNTSSGKMTCEKRNLNGREVIASLRYTLNFLVIDNEPFHSIQVLIPGLPSIILKTSEVTATNRDTIYDAIEMTMSNWPVKV
jgi:hypothetical protein